MSNRDYHEKKAAERRKKYNERNQKVMQEWLAKNKYFLGAAAIILTVLISASTNKKALIGQLFMPQEERCDYLDEQINYISEISPYTAFRAMYGEQDGWAGAIRRNELSGLQKSIEELEDNKKFWNCPSSNN